LEGAPLKGGRKRRNILASNLKRDDRSKTNPKWTQVP